MREIKFRAWDTVDKIMRYQDNVDGPREWPSLLAVGFHGLPICIDKDSVKDHEIVGWNRDHNLVLMQFTGLQDRNGKDIYEGDILQDSYYGKPQYVRWNDTIPGFGMSFKTGATTNIPGNCEIIGNIHENPELLEATP